MNDKVMEKITGKEESKNQNLVKEKVGEDDKHVTNNDFYINYKGEKQVSFGNNPKCPVNIDAGGSKKSINNIINNRQLEKEMHKDALESMYDYRIDDIKNETKQEYSKKLRCVQITAVEPTRIDMGAVQGTIDACVWYNHPNDFGDWYMEVDSKKGKVIYSQSFT